MKFKDHTSINLIKKRAKNLYFFLLNTKLDASKSKLLYEFNKKRPLGPKKYFCLAPFNSIVFGLGGKVRPCGNSQGLFEQYPEKKISEIWQGEIYNKLRESFHNNILPPSCGICKAAFSFKNFDSVMALKYDQFILNKNGYPSAMEFMIDNSCNLECNMCNGMCSSAIRLNRDKLDALPKKYDKNFVAQLREYIPHVKTINFIGGEPFLINILYDIWEIMAELNPNISSTITTNGTVLNDKIKNVLENGMFYINVSLDSLNKKVYENIRKNAVFETVIDNINWFHEYTVRKGTSFNINMCIIKDTWREVPAMIDFCNKLGCTIYFCEVIQPAQHAIWSLDSGEIKKILNYLKQFTFTVNTPNEQKNQLQYNMYLQNLNNWVSMAEKREASTHTQSYLNKDIVYSLLNEKYVIKKTLVNENDKDLLSQKINTIINNLPENLRSKFIIDKMFEIPDEMIIPVLLNESVETFINYLSFIKYFADSEEFSA